MLGPVIAFWAMGAPAAYLAGDVYLSKNSVSGADYLPLIAALFPPLGAVLALVVITQANQGEDQ